jgi:hypothetical protein
MLCGALGHTAVALRHHDQFGSDRCRRRLPGAAPACPRYLTLLPRQRESPVRASKQKTHALQQRTRPYSVTRWRRRTAMADRGPILKSLVRVSHAHATSFAANRMLSATAPRFARCAPASLIYHVAAGRGWYAFVIVRSASSSNVNFEGRKKIVRLYRQPAQAQRPSRHGPPFASTVPPGGGATSASNKRTTWPHHLSIQGTGHKARSSAQHCIRSATANANPRLRAPIAGFVAPNEGSREAHVSTFPTLDYLGHLPAVHVLASTPLPKPGASDLKLKTMVCLATFSSDPSRIVRLRSSM